MGKREGPPPEEGAPGWMATYADLMSLLLCFFVMLFSMSIIAPRRFQAAADTLAQDFTGHAGSSTTKSPRVQTTSVPSTSAAKDQRVAELIGGQPIQGVQGESDEVYVMRLDGETVQGGIICFEAGSDQLSAQAKQQLRNVLADLRGSPYKIMVKGRVAPSEELGNHSRFAELAFFRALNVVDNLVSLGLNQGDFEIVCDTVSIPNLNMLPPGTDPAMAGATVEIILLNQTTRDLQEGSK